jgi:perosamine synthetase
MQITSPSFDESEIENLKDCLASGWVTQGPYTKKFEERICDFQNLPYGSAVTSCTAALHLAALALELGPGDEVIVPAFTWITSANLAEYVGATVVFVDVNPMTFNIDPKKVEDAITSKTKAIVAVHLFGLSAPMDELMAIANNHGIAVIEDAACAIGTLYKGKPIGAIGDFGCFSFHPRKVITTGEGGLISTANKNLHEKVLALRNHGANGLKPEDAIKSPPWAMAEFPYLGFNYRMSDIQAAVGCAQAEKVERLLKERRDSANHYNQLLMNAENIIIPSDPDQTGGHSYQSYVVRLSNGDKDQRNRIMLSLEQQNIQTRPGTHAVHRLAYYSEKYELNEGDFPNSALCEDTTITLPIFPLMKSEDRERVASLLIDAMQAE